MRVCIFYTHPYPIKSLNHTLFFRKCKLYFGANMQVASTIWPDIKSYKISEQRFRLRWTKCSPRTNPNEVKTGKPQYGSEKEAQDSLLEEVGGGWWPGQANWPTRSADLARGPHLLNQGRLPIGPLGRLQRFSPMAPCYKYKEGRERVHTPHFLSSLARLA